MKATPEKDLKRVRKKPGGYEERAFQAQGTVKARFCGGNCAWTIWRGRTVSKVE